MLALDLVSTENRDAEGYRRDLESEVADFQQQLEQANMMQNEYQQNRTKVNIHIRYRNWKGDLYIAHNYYRCSEFHIEWHLCIYEQLFVITNASLTPINTLPVWTMLKLQREAEQLRAINDMKEKARSDTNKIKGNKYEYNRFNATKDMCIYGKI